MQELEIINSNIIDEIKSSIKVHSVFTNTMNLIHNDIIITLGNKQYLTKGPNRVILNELPKSIDLDTKVYVEDGKIIIGDYFINLCYCICTDVVFFEPKNRENFLNLKNIDELDSFLFNSDVENYFQFLRGEVFGAIKTEQFNRLRNVLNDFCFYNIEKIIGLGEGLTPSSDDFLLGYCIGKNIFDFDERFNHELLQLVKLKTNILSYNFLFNTLRGHLSIEWENLLQEMNYMDIKIETLEKIKSFGGTSGIYILSGFLAYLVKEIGGKYFEKDFS